MAFFTKLRQGSGSSVGKEPIDEVVAQEDEGYALNRSLFFVSENARSLGLKSADWE